MNIEIDKARICKEGQNSMIITPYERILSLYEVDTLFDALAEMAWRSSIDLEVVRGLLLKYTGDLNLTEKLMLRVHEMERHGGNWGKEIKGDGE